MPEPTPTTPPPAPQALPAPTIAGDRQAEDNAVATHPAPEAKVHKHHFDFDALNASHTMPYPAIEPIHGNPVLILNVAEYADLNYASLSESPDFATAAPTPEQQAWAQRYVQRKESFLDDAGKPKHFQTTPANLAKAMTVAQHDSMLGSLPQALSFLNQQTFWSTIALLLGALALVVFRRKPTEYKPSGRFQHMLEATVLFVRNEVVRPTIKHNADWWTPFFASMFLVILTCNLFGLVPIFATATGNIAVTAAFALVTAFLMFFMGFKEQGPVHFWVSLVPLKWSWNPISMGLWFFLFVLEFLQLFIRPTVLAIRLTINMFAGHSVLLVFASLGFIIYAADHQAMGLAKTMGAAGWVLLVGLYLLELLVAFLQAYIFTMLSAVFIGLCANPEH